MCSICFHEINEFCRIGKNFIFCFLNMILLQRVFVVFLKFEHVYTFGSNELYSFIIVCCAGATQSLRTFRWTKKRRTARSNCLPLLIFSARFSLDFENNLKQIYLILFFAEKVSFLLFFLSRKRLKFVGLMNFGTVFIRFLPFLFFQTQDTLNDNSWTMRCSDSNLAFCVRLETLFVL